MRRIYWLLLLLATILSVVLLGAAISARMSEQTIYSVSNEDSIRVIQTALADHNTNFSVKNLTIVDAQYINDSIAVLKVNNDEGQRINFLFEFYNGTLYLTNYSTSRFTREELQDPELLNYINNAIDA